MSELTRFATQQVALMLEQHEAVQTQYQKFTLVKSNTGIVQFTFNYFKNVPAMREWIGNRVHHKFEDASFSLETKLYELTVDADIDKINSGLVLNYELALSGVGEAAKMLSEDLATALLNAGETTLCYDGQYFYDTDHPSGVEGITNDNTLTGNGVALSALSADVTSVKNKMKLFRIGLTDSGDTRRFGKAPDLYVVPCANGLKESFNKLNTLDYLATGIPNPHKGTIPPDSVLENPNLTDANNWHAFHTASGIYKPFIECETYGLKMNVLGMDGNDAALSETNSVSFQAKRRTIVAPFAWFTAVLVKNS